MSKSGENEFVIFPNPFTEWIYLIKNEYYDLEIVISDMSGKVVLTGFSPLSDNLFVPISTTELSGGTYIVTLYYQQSYRTFKLVKQ